MLLRVLVAQPLGHRRLHDDDVVDDERRRVRADFARLERDLTLSCRHLPKTTPSFRSTTPSLPNGGDRLAGLRVQLDEAIADRHVDDPLVALAVGPVRQAAARELARRHLRAPALVHAVHPLQLAGLRVERHDRAARAAGRVEHALDHQRRAFELVLGTRAEVVGLEAPGDFELVEVGGVDLIEGRCTGCP